LIGCVCGLISRFEGAVRVAGHDVVRDYRVTRQLVGLVPQELNYDAFFTTADALAFQGGYFGKKGYREKAGKLLDIFRLREKANANTRSLSGGMKRRLMICKALVHDPVLLFLDEPTAGVDVELREELWNYIEELRRAGTTIVLTTHYLEEAERLADRIGIIHKGVLLRVDERENLMREFGRKWLEVSLSGPVSRALLENLADLRARSPGDRRLRIEFADALVGTARNPLHRLQEAVRAAGLTVDEIEGGRSRLEEVFREVVNGNGDAS
jgi:ABC-2 type transport system ATP-binding protein